ncbi:putative coniferyl aldehyde dehydrogenase [Sterolibacterium denitrificans]|uniref:Aldehyde dehydrogenase n=1 Tax=Sterolibacterium denitrificans TaxID=157592 RepID=A0A7Z7HPH9_9PROT|nr:coniferyl aldehyde dehydrogenase [Sterolibacterium denitrificans]SMB22772.1 putative coniferyl aldehyde dehydrogenase [Sterolibacterium denitrificans]
MSQLPADLKTCLEHQRTAYLADPEPDYATRRADLDQLARLLKENRAALIEAINRDYGNRSHFETLFVEFFVALDEIKDTRRHLRKWMKPQRRHADLLTYPGARNRLIPQPLGVVGVIVPWNFPLLLSIGPLIAIFAAGNRAMVKMSENSQHLARLLAELSPNYFPADKLTFFVDDGGGTLGPAFSQLPFDHLLFTGSSRTGQAVMANAAQNLTPVTLELGGKSPAVVAPDFPLKTAAERILWVKLLNAGQICTTVDYLFLPAGKVDEFIAQAQRLVAARYPDLDSPDYTAIIDEPAYQRLTAALADAEAKGARLINLAPAQTPAAGARKFVPHLVLDVSDEMELMQREIFGPILPIKTYRQPQEVVDYVNAHPRPLAFYPFTHDRKLQDWYLRRIMSGGVSVNDALLHVGQHDLPFGGVGASGMGHYHGREGFMTFSKLRPVFYQGPVSAVQMLFQPPYGKRAFALIELLLKLKG